MELLILKQRFLLVKQLNKVLDEIKEVSWCDVVELLSWFGKFPIQLNDSTMNSNNSIDNNIVPLLILLNGSLKRLNNRVNNWSELFSNL